MSWAIFCRKGAMLGRPSPPWTLFPPSTSSPRPPHRWETSFWPPLPEFDVAACRPMLGGYFPSETLSLLPSLSRWQGCHPGRAGCVDSGGSRAVHALAVPSGMGRPKGHDLGLACWAWAQRATVALGCSVAQLNSRVFLFFLQFNPNEIQFKYEFGSNLMKFGLNFRILTCCI
jgi:hypothetical protein